MQHSHENVSDMASGDKDPESEEGHGNVAPVRSRRIRVRDLLGNDREVILEHAGQEYRLRITSKGKLILTK